MKIDYKDLAKKAAAAAIVAGLTVILNELISQQTVVEE